MSSARPNFIRGLIAFLIPTGALVSPAVVSAQQQEQTPGAMLQEVIVTATKRAVNRVADAGGFRAALYAGLDVVGPLYATTTEHGARFREIARTEGVPAAVRWRSAQFQRSDK